MAERRSPARTADALSDPPGSADAPGGAKLSTRDAIIRAAWSCYREKGPGKTTITDISRAAGVSRGTVYQHFKDKGQIQLATAESASSEFFAALLAYMDEGDTLEDQLCRAGMFLCRSRNQLRSWEQLYDKDETALLLTTRAEPLLRDCIERFVPYFEAARDRDELREDLDLRSAAEWASRILFSLYSTSSPFLDLDDPNEVRRFIGDHIVIGMLPRPDRPPSAAHDLPGLGEIASILDGR